MIDVIIPAYNAERYISQTLESLVSQADSIGSIIVVNDGSTDNSLELAVQLTEADCHVVLIDLSRNFGHHKAMMTGLAASQGDHVFLIDSDLVWVGPAANYAAKLNSFDGLDTSYPIRVTEEVYKALSTNCLIGSAGELMWEGPYSNFDPRRHYRSRHYQIIG